MNLKVMNKELATNTTLSHHRIVSKIGARDKKNGSES